MLNNHFKLYEGYVKNANLLAEKLVSLDSASPEYAELKRRFGWEFNGMRLHELYFENMTKETGTDKLGASKLSEQMDADFGKHSADKDPWANDFKSTGAMRGIGWVVLYFDTVSKQLFNCWINEHDEGHLSGCVPLLIMDVFEHAYITDYGIDRKSYIQAFFNAIDWNIVEQRYNACK